MRQRDAEPRPRRGAKTESDGASDDDFLLRDGRARCGLDRVLEQRRHLERRRDDAEQSARPAKGPADSHCKGKPPQQTSMAVCQMPGTAKTDYGPPMYGSEGDDDDC